MFYCYYVGWLCHHVVLHKLFSFVVLTGEDKLSISYKIDVRKRAVRKTDIKKSWCDIRVR